MSRSRNAGAVEPFTWIRQQIGLGGSADGKASDG